MTFQRFSKSDTRGYTLGEMSVALGVSSLIFAALIFAGATLRRSFTAADQYSQATNDQMRAIDYITRDLREAWTITVSADAQTLTITLPDCYNNYDADGNPTGNPWDPSDTNLKAPTVSGATVNYGDPTKPITVSYYVSNQKIVRQQWWYVAGVQRTASNVIASDVDNFQFHYQDLNSVVNSSITFTPSFHTVFWSGARQATTISASTSVRNVRRN